MARSPHPPSTPPQHHLIPRFLVDLALHRDGLHACVEGCQRLILLGIDGPIDEAHCTAIQALRGSWQAKLAALEACLVNDSVSDVGEPQ